MVYDRTKDIPVSPVSICEFIPSVSPVSTHVSIHVISDIFSKTPRVLTLKRIIPYIFPVHPSVIICLCICPIFSRIFVWINVCLLSYLSNEIKTWCKYLARYGSISIESLFSNLIILYFESYCIRIQSLVSKQIVSNKNRLDVFSLCLNLFRFVSAPWLRDISILWISSLSTCLNLSPLY